MAETASARLLRLLTMVPWLLHRQGIDLTEAAQGLGVSVDQLESDLQLLFLCGYGQMPDELIEADWEHGQVFLGNAEAISRPLRLGVDEAVTLIVGLKTLLDVPGLSERDAIERALAKLEAAAGSAAEPASRVSVDLADGAVRDDVIAGVREALDRTKRLHLTYFVPGRDESTERDVDPMRLLGQDGRWYLEAWCHRAQGVRFFRLDRIESLHLLDEDGTPPPGVAPRAVGESIYNPTVGDAQVTIRLRPGSLWVADYYPVETSRADGDDLIVTLRTADTTWIERLALRSAGHVQVLDPPQVRVRIAARAQAALDSQSSAVD